MSFQQGAQQVKLQGRSNHSPKEISHQQVKRLISSNKASTYYPIQGSPTPQTTPTPPSLPPQIQCLLHRFTHLFQQPTSLPPTRPTDHAIHLKPSQPPVNVRPYRYPYFQKQEIEKQVDDMLRRGMIQLSRSPFSSSVLLVRKKDGTWRFCVDYRALNSITVKDRFPIPTIDELLDDLGTATWFSKLDLARGFHQILMQLEDIPKTAFRTHHGHYEYKVMPFGLCNAPSTFQATMNELFMPFLRKFVLVFFDDILIFSKCFADHLKHLDMVFHILDEGKFFLKESKCAFSQRSIEYLGHIVSEKGVAAEPSKIKAMVDWPPPTTLKALRGFLGLTGFYRRFIKGYANIAAPLTQLLRKDSFHWNNEAQTAFNQLKEAMVQAPVLALPNFSQPFVVETDASGSGMGAVLMQHNHPIAYFSKQFCPKLLHSSTYIRELHAITAAVKKWRQYLLGHPFIILTDHRSLKELMSQAI